VSAKAKSTCTAPNPHNSKAKPNHGQCVSAVAKSGSHGNANADKGKKGNSGNQGKSGDDDSGD
jgi:hypothetical protein